MSFLASPSSSPTSFPFVSGAAATGTVPRRRCRRAAAARAPRAALTRPRATPPRAPALPGCADASPAPQHRHRALRRPAWPRHRRAPPLPPHATASALCAARKRHGVSLRGTPCLHCAPRAACSPWPWARRGHRRRRLAWPPCRPWPWARARVKQRRGGQAAGPGPTGKWGPAVSPLFIVFLFVISAENFVNS